MKLDLKIEVFSYDLFHSVWFTGGLISQKLDATDIYKDECLSDNDYQEVCDDLFYNAVLCRRILFQRIYTKEIMKEKDRYWDSVTDFYNYIHSTCNHYELFGCLTVFERMFATCAFVLNLCYYNRENKNVDIIIVGHMCWAKYFNAFTEEFYEQGGWNQLKNVANSYTLPLRSLQICLNDPENALTEVTEAVENYNNLKQTSIMHECETVSKLWIKSHINNLQKSSKNPVELADYESFLHAEHILNELKRLCSPCVLEIIEFDEECSERLVVDSDSLYLPLTPIASQELRDRKISISSSSDGNSEESLPTVDSDFTNRCLSEHVDITSSNYCDDMSCACLDILEHLIEFESISLISDCEQDQYLSRSLTKLKLNHDTLKLEETTISETDFSNCTNDRCSVEDPVPSTTDKNLVPQEMNKHFQILEDSMDAIKLVSKDTRVKKLSVTEGTPSHKGFKEGEFAHVTTFSNIDFSHGKQLSISITEWDEKDLAKNISTPIKQK